MKLRKIVSIATVAAVCVSLLSACYAPEDTSVTSLYEMSSYETASVTSQQPAAKYSVSLSKTFENWVPTDTTGFVYYMSNGDTSLQVYKAADKAGATLDDAATYLAQDIEENYLNVVTTENAVDATIGGVAAKKTFFTADAKGLYAGKTNELSLNTNTYYAVALGDEIYVIRILCPASTYENEKAVLNEIAASVQFTPVA